jgi:hypothetical protein
MAVNCSAKQEAVSEGFGARRCKKNGVLEISPAQKKMLLVGFACCSVVERFYFPNMVAEVNTTTASRLRFGRPGRACMDDRAIVADSVPETAQPRRLEAKCPAIRQQWAPHLCRFVLGILDSSRRSCAETCGFIKKQGECSQVRLENIPAPSASESFRDGHLLVKFLFAWEDGADMQNNLRKKKVSSRWVQGSSLEL